MVDGVSICFGAGRTAVEATIGKGKFVRDRYYYFDSELSISYDQFGNVIFIEFLGGIEGRWKPSIYGVSVFDADAKEICELLKQHNGSEMIDTEQGYCYSFLNLSIGLYREATPESVAEMIEESKRLGEPMDHAEIEFERKRANHWASIGIGTAGYYQLP